jgi:hypothetical protein
MDHDPSQRLSKEQLIQLVDALGEIRDSCILMSLVLKDWVAETPSPIRDEVLLEVDRCLCRMRQAD